MALLNAYFYLLFIDLANFYTRKLDDTTAATATNFLDARMVFVIMMNIE